jgi:DNA-binding IclR family transcriptional regulator
MTKRNKTARSRKQTSLGRMLAIIDAFDAENYSWTVDTLSHHLGYTKSTLYRYLRELVDAQFLTSLPDIGYTLGPRIIELDYIIAHHDPLIIASRPLMAQLADEYSGVVTLCRSYRQKVLCVHQERGAVNFMSGYVKGQPRPLLRGSASRVILANLPPTLISRLYQLNVDAFRSAGFGETLNDLRVKLKNIRDRGWDVTLGEVTPGVTGISTPIFDARENLLGSLSLALLRTGIAPDAIELIGERMRFCSRSITRMLANQGGERLARVRPGRSLENINLIISE